MNKEKTERMTQWQRIISFIFVVIFLVGFMGFSVYLYIQLNNVAKTLDGIVAEKELLEAQLDETRDKLESTKTELESTKIELDATNSSLTNALEENARLSEEIEEYETYIEEDEAKWKRRFEEYNTASEVWVCMKAQGWSDVVCAGIMGNLMAETGGSGTLHLDWDSNGGNGYGLVQWTGGRRSTIKNRYGTYPSIQAQVQFIHDELYGVNGVRRQVTDSQFDAIMNAETPEECAYAFACYYERCAGFARGMRRGYARKAYEYFVG